MSIDNENKYKKLIEEVHNISPLANYVNLLKYDDLCDGTYSWDKPKLYDQIFWSEYWVESIKEFLTNENSTASGIEKQINIDNKQKTAEKGWFGNCTLKLFLFDNKKRKRKNKLLNFYKNNGLAELRKKIQKN